MRNNNIEYLVGKNLFDHFPDKPYNNLVCKFLEDLSNLLLNHRDSIKYPDIKTLGFWCRKKNILRLKNNFKSENLELVLVWYFTLHRQTYLQILLTLLYLVYSQVIQTLLKFHLKIFTKSN